MAGLASPERRARCLKYGSLLGFLVQNSIVGICFRFAMTENSSDKRANTQVVLFVMELTKFLLSFCLLLAEESLNLCRTLGVLRRDALGRPAEALQLGVPAVIYAVQNLLLLRAAGHLPAAVWQVTYQGKILVTAGFSVVLLQKQIQRVQWLAIFIMGAGIAIVELSNPKEGEKESMANFEEQSFARGLLMLLMACCCSGFASVFTEMIFKQIGAAKDQVKKSVWLQNMQLAFFTQLILVLAIVSEELRAWEHKPIFAGFSWTTWVTCFVNAIGGLLVAMVIKYADNILRGFASSLATILNALMSVGFFGFHLTPWFGLGTLTVLGSAMLYGGVVKLPGPWWNSEFDCCGSLSASSAAQSGATEAKDSRAANLEVSAKDRIRDVEDSEEEEFSPLVRDSGSKSPACVMGKQLSNDSA